MKPIWKWWLVFPLILVMVLGILPVANASQIEPNQIPEETAAPETITQTEEPATETTVPTVQEETLPEETVPFIAGNVESSIALLAEPFPRWSSSSICTWIRSWSTRIMWRSI